MAESGFKSGLPVSRALRNGKQEYRKQRSIHVQDTESIFQGFLAFPLCLPWEDTLFLVPGSRSAARLTRTCWPKYQDVIHPANLSSSPLPWDFPEPPSSSLFAVAQGPQKHLALLLLSFFEALNKKSKKISRKEAEKKKRSSKVGLGVLIVGLGLGLKGEDP